MQTAKRVGLGGASMVLVAITLGGCASDKSTAGNRPAPPTQARNDGCQYLQPDRSQPGLGRNFPRTEDYRPKGESGRAVVSVCVAADGRLVGEPTVLRSSGNPRVDQAAIAMMKAGTYCPAMRDGVAVERCFPMSIVMGPDGRQ